MLKSFRYLLFPFSILYGIAVWIRNFLFDKKILKSAQFNFPIICVGNLAVGGTGKTPMVEYLIEKLHHNFQIATLSRGYKRKTKGFTIANQLTTAIDIGDEPMQFHQKFPSVIVAVGEERIFAIPQILHQHPETRVIILDDAFQHRPVHAGLNILLTDYNNLYTRDLMMPSGDLRDIKSSSKRAEIIVITKCPVDLQTDESDRIKKEINLLSYQKLFFTTIEYGMPYHIFNNQKHSSLRLDFDVLLICGIANPSPLVHYLTAQVKSFDMIRYPDHHIFSSDNLREIKVQFEKITSEKKLIITTEKDAVRLYKYRKELESYPIYVLPVSHRFLFNQSADFDQMVYQFIHSFATN